VKKISIKLFFSLILLILIILLLDYILPVKVVKFGKLKKTDIYMPEELNSYFLSYDIYTSSSKFSTADKLDVLKSMEKNNVSISMITDCTKESQQMENIYKNKILLSKCYVKDRLINFSDFTIVPFGEEIDELQKNQCKEFLNLTKSLDFNVVDFPKIFKFFLWYPFNKERAYQNLRSVASFDEYISNFNPQKTTCILGGVGAYSRIKTANIDGKSLILDFNYLLGMVKNKIYTYDMLSIDLKRNKEIIFNALKNGNNIIYLTNKDLDVDIFIKGITKNYLVGNVVDLSEKPVINLKVKGNNVFTSVLLNGKPMKHYLAKNIKLTPKNSGSYTFIIYRYKMRLPFNILLGVSPIAITNSIYFQ
jgi:hypothetical protein